MRGPKLRYLDRAATYTVVVSNPGDAPANEVRVSAAVPVGFNVETPSDNGRFDSMTRTISWVVGTVEPGEKKEVSYRCSATQIGEHKHMVTAEGARGLRGANDLMTKVEGIASLLMELADVDDPIEVGAETAYEVRITNHGSAPAMNVEIRALVPKAMTITSCQGPMEYKVEGPGSRLHGDSETGAEGGSRLPDHGEGERRRRRPLPRPTRFRFPLRTGHRRGRDEGVFGREVAESC